MFKWRDKRIAKSVKAQLEKEEETFKEMRKQFDTEIESLRDIKNITKAIESIRLRVPIEDVIRESSLFKNALSQGCQKAEQYFMPRFMGHGLELALPSLKGQVSKEKNYETTTSEDEVTVIAGLKTQYEGKDQAVLEIQIGNQYLRSIIVSARDQQILFLQPILLLPEYLFKIFQKEGNGSLTFSVIGTTITRNYRF